MLSFCRVFSDMSQNMEIAEVILHRLIGASTPEKCLKSVIVFY